MGKGMSSADKYDDHWVEPPTLNIEDLLGGDGDGSVEEEEGHEEEEGGAFPRK